METPKIIVDHRESKSTVSRVLYRLGANLEQKQLHVGDYQLSDRVCVERKELSDFVKSIIDKRLFAQLKELKQNYKIPLLLIEGEGSLYCSNVHPNAIRGALASIAIDYGIPILWTDSMEDTAQTLFHIAKREQFNLKKDFSPHGSKKPMGLREAQEYVVSAIPNVGIMLAKNLLKEFGTIKAISLAEEKALKKVSKVGNKKAKSIKKLFEEEYKHEEEL